MPWTTKDVESHKKGLSAKQKTLWVKIANAALERCLDKIEGVPTEAQEKKCAGSAIKQASAVAGRMKEQAVGGPDICVCPDCDYEIAKERGTPCRSVACPECGAKLIAKVEEREMPFTDVAQIAASAIETGLAFLTGDTNVGQADGLRLLEALQGDLDTLLEAKTKTIDGKPRPAGDFLVVEDADKVGTWHLPVKVNGRIDHKLMGAARAALTVGSRGNKYEGPGKAAAIKKLEAMYEAEEMEWAEVAMPEGVRELLERALSLFDEVEAAESDIAESVLGGIIALMEADAQPAEGNRAPLRLEFALIKPGFGNARDNRYYPADVLKRDAHVFEGVKMYTTDHKQGEKSERTEVAVVEKMPARFLDDGTPVGVAAIFDPGFAEKTRNRATMGKLATLENSILGKGRIKHGKIGEQDANIVEAITRGVSVDWVTKAGAGGRALNLAENEEVNGMSEEERIEEETKTEPVETDPVKEIFLSEAEADSILAEAKLPDEAKARLRERQHRDADALTEAVNAEAEYIKAVSGSGKPVMAPGKVTAPTTRTLAERNEAVKAVNQKWLGG